MSFVGRFMSTTVVATCFPASASAWPEGGVTLRYLPYAWLDTMGD